MCGIVGLLNWNFSPVVRPILECMTNLLAHRGPNGNGVFVREFVGLGHRRLSIIDLEGGKQPLSNEEGTLWITFNGEIYNYKELQQTLSKKGHRFRTKSDTEVIVYAYKEWGDDCVKHLRGMFAFGIADFHRRRIFLARDHFGIKPLYYARTPTAFVFASELQALRPVPDISWDIDLQAVDQYLCFQYIPAPRTIFKNIFKLLPAHRMSISFDQKAQLPEPYWNLEFRPNFQRKPKEWMEAVEETLKESVRAHLVSDVPFGAFLSGGIDSSLVVNCMSEILREPVKTFSIGFDDPSFNEISFASQVADQCHTEHHVEILKADALQILPELVRNFGEPFGDSSAIPTFYVSKLARQSVPMVLSGDGGDEFFAGYSSYSAWMRWLEYGDLTTFKRQMGFLFHGLFHPKQRPFFRSPQLKHWLCFIQSVSVETRKELWRPEHQKTLDCSEKKNEKFPAILDSYSAAHKVQWMDIHTYLPDDILTKVDRASMMHGLEVRTPFVDLKVAELAVTIPSELNLSQNSFGEWEGKILLKNVIQKYYPPSFVRRPKQGFAVPLEKWFSPKQDINQQMTQRLLSASSPLAAWFNSGALQMVMKKGMTNFVWSLLFLDEWVRQFKTPLHPV